MTARTQCVPLRNKSWPVIQKPRWLVGRPGISPRAGDLYSVLAQIAGNSPAVSGYSVRQLGERIAVSPRQCRRLLLELESHGLIVRKVDAPGGPCEYRFLWHPWMTMVPGRKPQTSPRALAELFRDGVIQDAQRPNERVDKQAIAEQFMAWMTADSLPCMVIKKMIQLFFHGPDGFDFNDNRPCQVQFLERAWKLQDQAIEILCTTPREVLRARGW